MTLDELDTPCLVLDAGKVERNIARMRAKVHGLGSTLRPHVKTPKCIEVARLAHAGANGPITVSTLKEADYFFEHGMRDMLYAVGIAPGKLDHVARLRRSGAELSIVLDSVEAARMVEAGGRARTMRFPVLIEIDCDGHRSGVKPGDPVLLEIASALQGAGALLRGVMTHAGDSYNCTSIAAIRGMAEREREAVVSSAAMLREAGHAIKVVSVGSTPTATYAERLDGVTEVRAGVFVFFDLVMAGLDVCAIDDIALSVLATVIGHQREKGWLITDAGWMAMSRDRGTAKQRIDQGYGVVCDIDGRPIEGFIMADANQEHSIVAQRDQRHIDAAHFPIGTRLRILPNHACATGAQHPDYHVVRGGRKIETVWQRFSGW
ncbi:MAG: DSD1 family PLP-dependent enzyme [Burkholderiales bacterium]